MPTTPRKARILIKEGRAKIVDYNPFTIQLLYGTRGYTQPVTLGIDAGDEHIGFSDVTESDELIGGELSMLTGVTAENHRTEKVPSNKKNSPSPPCAQV